MAYIVTSSVTAEEVATTTVTVELPEHEVDDVLFIFHGASVGTTASTVPSGWTELTPRPSNVNGQRQQVFYQVVTSAPVTNPTITLGASYTSENHVIVVRGADTTTPVDIFATANASTAVPSINAPAITTTVDNCLVIYCALGYLVTSSPSTARSNTVPVLRSKLSGLMAMVTGYRNQFTTGTVSTFSYQKQVITGTSGMTIFAVAVRDDGNGKFGPNQTSVGSEVSPYAYVGQESIADLTGIPFATLDGLTTTSAACTETLTNGEWIAPIYLVSAEAIDAWVGGIDTVSLDLSDTTTVIKLTIGSSGSSVRMGVKGVAFALVDSSNNWVAFRSATKAQGIGRQTVYVNPHTATKYEESGTPPDLSDITRIVFLSHRDNDTGTIGSNGVNFQDFLIFNSTNTVLTGGCIESPLDLTKTHLKFSQARNPSSSLQGVGQFILNTAFTIGDGSTETYADLRFISIETPKPYSATQFRWNVDAAYITLNASASDTILFNNSILNANTTSYFTVNSGSSTSATYDFTGIFLKNFYVTWKAGVLCDSITFNQCKEIDFKAATVTNCLIQDQQDQHACKVNDGAEITDCVFETTVSTQNAIDILEAGNYDLSNTTFTGYTTDLNITPATGTVTIALATDQTEPTYTSAGATVVFDQPIPTQTVTVTNGVVGTRLQIYDLTSSTELYNDVPASFPYTWTDPSPYVADREIRVRASYYDALDAKEFVEANIGTSTDPVPDLSYRLNQVEDVVYVNNAIDGGLVTDVVINDTGLLIEMDTGAISWKSIYAYEVYWLSTAVGIADEGKIIEAIDEATYVLYDFKIKNVTSPEVPLTITDGYGYDSVTKTTIELFDTTGGAIFAAPDRVISYAVGSGLSPSEQTDLALIKTRTGLIPASL